MQWVWSLTEEPHRFTQCKYPPNCHSWTECPHPVTDEPSTLTLSLLNWVPPPCHSWTEYHHPVTAELSAPTLSQLKWVPPPCHRWTEYPHLITAKMSAPTLSQLKWVPPPCHSWTEYQLNPVTVELPSGKMSVQHPIKFVLHYTLLWCNFCKLPMFSKGKLPQLGNNSCKIQLKKL